MNNHDDYDIEQEAALSGLAAMVAHGYSPKAIAQGWMDILNSTDRENRWRRLTLARLFAGIFERVAASDHPDAERCRNLAAKLRAIEAANTN